MRELFVYYRIDAGRASAAREAVEAMHDRLRRRHPGLLARLLVRGDDGTTTATWMETYALPGSPEGIDARIEAGIETDAAAWAQLRAGPRHLEAFTAAASRG